MNGIRNAVLVLENGKCFVGTGVGATKTVSGELVFNTATAAGYNAILTDPSNFGQIVTMTYPPIGNYGVPAKSLDEFGLDKHFESESVKARGIVMFECCKKPFHWESVQTLDSFLNDQGIPGIEGVDTRAIVQLLRAEGLQKSLLQVLPPGKEPNIPALQEAVTTAEDVNQQDLVSQVSIKQVKIYNEAAPEKIVLVDMGVMNYEIRQLVRRKFCVVRVPHNTPFANIMEYKPNGVLISSGPGNPIHYRNAIEVAKSCLAEKLPLFGICLGNLIIGLAAGAKVTRLKYGHRGGNKACLDLTSNNCYITVQNHTYALDPDSLKPADMIPYFINVDDKTVEGFIHTSKPAFGVQFHPEPSPGSRDPDFLFTRFEKLIRGGAN